MGRVKNKTIRQIEAEVKALLLLARATAKKWPEKSAEYARRAEELEAKYGLSKTTTEGQ